MSQTLIIDTDVWVDCGDMLGLAVGHGLVSCGDATIAAVIHDTSYAGGVTTADVLNTYCGRGSIPCGQWKGAAIETTSPSPVYSFYLNANYPSTYTYANAPDSTTLYRTLLAASPNNSVAIAGIGPLNCLSALLQSPADGISSLTGSQLVAAKVSRLVEMAGDYPSAATAEFNMVQSVSASQYVAANWPSTVPLWWMGVAFTQSIRSGESVWQYLPMSHPTRYAMNLQVGQANVPSWDELPVLAAATGLGYRGSAYFSLSAAGTNVVHSDGTNTFTAGTGGTQAYVSLASGATPDRVAQTLNQLMAVSKPKFVGFGSASKVISLAASN